MYSLDKSKLTGSELAVWELIEGRKGQFQSITSTQIEEKTGMNRFQTCKVVQTLRLQYKIPIASNKYGVNKGYFLPVSRAEIKVTIEEMVKQAETLLAVVDVLDKAII